MTDTKQAVMAIDSLPAPEQSAAQVMGLIARAAEQPQMDVEKMERLTALYERVKAREAEVAFNAAMRLAQSEIPRIKKDARNPSTNSMFARLETLNKALVPVYTKHGFSLSYGTGECQLKEGGIRITCKVSHSGGHTRDYALDLPLDMVGIKGLPNKTAIHGFGSTLSYGRRYLALLIFNVSTGDDDDGNGGTGQGESDVFKLKQQLWNLLKPVRGDAVTWDQARQWLVDECCLDPDIPINQLNAAAMAAVIRLATEKLNRKPQ